MVLLALLVAHIPQCRQRMVHHFLERRLHGKSCTLRQSRCGRLCYVIFGGNADRTNNRKSPCQRNKIRKSIEDCIHCCNLRFFPLLDQQFSGNLQHRSVHNRFGHFELLSTNAVSSTQPSARSDESSYSTDVHGVRQLVTPGAAFDRNDSAALWNIHSLRNCCDATGSV